jgi:hypothetical protein
VRYAVAVLMVCLSVSVIAQVATSRLEGLVQDSSGAVIPRAGITAVNNRTAVSTITLSDTEGSFRFLSMAPGEYTVTAEAPGFRKLVIKGVVLNASATVVENFRMQLGAVTEAITVEAKETTMQTSDAQSGATVSMREIEVQPQLDRNPIVLAIFQPGAQIIGGNIGNSRINGTRLGSNTVKIDGVDAANLFGGGLGLASLIATPESTQEVRIVTHSGKAEYGRSAGAQVEMITRSGTNRWSGNAFDHFRNTGLNANSFFSNASGVPRAKLIQNVFGATAGGPLQRDRTFLFASYEGRRSRQDIMRDRRVLTPEARSGMFRWRPPGAAEIRSFDIDRDDPRGKGIDPQVAEILRLLPDPNHFDIGDGLNMGGYRFNNPSHGTQDSFTTRADHHLSRAVRLFFRFSRLRFDGVDAFNNADAPFPGRAQGRIRVGVWGYSLGFDWGLGPHSVNEFRFGSHVSTSKAVRPARVSGPMLLANSWTDPLSPLFAGEGDVPVWEITDNLSLVRGKHVFKVGVNGHLAALSSSTDAGIYPNVTFSRTFAVVPPTIGPSGAVISSADRGRFEDLYNDLLGRIGQVSQTFYSNLEEFQAAGTPRVRNYRMREYGYFVQDDWKVKRSVTLNLGLRYEFNGVPFERDGLLGVVDRAADINYSSRIADLTIRRAARWYHNDFNNVAPRIGVAWDVKGDGKTTVRAGYGVFYERLVAGVSSFIDSQTPGFSQILPVFPNSTPGSDVRVSDGIPLPVRPPAPTLHLPPTRSNNLAVINPNLRTGYVQHYSLTLQRELFRNTVIEAGFVGSRGVKLFMQVNPNQARIHGDFLQAFREIQEFRSSGAPVPPSNTLVRLFGSAGGAINALGANRFDDGAAMGAAITLDLSPSLFGRYPAAGISDFYLRSYPQYNQLLWGTNDGRLYYDSLQVTLRRRSGALKFVANYTWSKTIDVHSGQGSDAGRPIDSFNLRLSRTLADTDRPHVLNGSVIYTLPVGNTRRVGDTWPRWLDSIIGGWEVGLLGLWESGAVFSVFSGRQTAGDLFSSYANFFGDARTSRVDRRGDGVYWFSPDEIARFSFPAAGEIGFSGRNAFRGPRHFNLDASLVKRFRLSERQAIAFRAEFYNLFNNPNFAIPSNNLAVPASFGKISALASGTAGGPVGSTSGGPRIVQLALRYQF